MPVLSARAFTPTPAQLRFLDYVHAHPGFSTIAELCASCDVDPSSYYKWCHDPAFKQWLTAEWSSRLLFEGWHFLNLARANCTNSATHFRVLMNLLFDPKGQAALTAWQQSASSQAALTAWLQSITPEPPSPGPAPINAMDSQVPPNQSKPPANSSFSAFSAPFKPNPGMTVKHLALNLSRLQRQPLRDSPVPRPPTPVRLHRPRPRPACHARAAAPLLPHGPVASRCSLEAPRAERGPDSQCESGPADRRSPPASDQRERPNKKWRATTPPVPGGVEPPAPPVTATALLPHLTRMFTLDNPFSLPLVHVRLRCARLMLHAVELVSLEDRLACLEQTPDPSTGLA